MPRLLIGWPNSIGWQGREGGGISPYDDIQGKFQNGASELRFSQKQPTKCLATGGAQVGQGNSYSCQKTSEWDIFMPWDLSVFQVMEILNPALPILHNRVWYHIVPDGLLPSQFLQDPFCRTTRANIPRGSYTELRVDRIPRLVWCRSLRIILNLKTSN